MPGLRNIFIVFYMYHVQYLGVFYIEYLGVPVIFLDSRTTEVLSSFGAPYFVFFEKH